MAARITRGGAAPVYSPPLHEGVVAHRLQGHEAGPTTAFWVGHSLYPPGSSASLSPAAAETVYVVLDGELTLVVEDGPSSSTDLLRRGDSVHLTAGTRRSVRNEGSADAELLVVIAAPQPVSDTGTGTSS